MAQALRLVVGGVVAAAVLVAATLRADDARQLKIIASAHDSPRVAQIGPIQLDENAGIVIRSAEELVAASSQAQSAKDAAVQRKLEAELVELLQVDGIDWTRQMAVAVRGVPGTRADRIHFDSLKVDGRVLTVAWRVRPRPPHAGPGTPIALILVERFDGEVKFAP